MALTQDDLQAIAQLMQSAIQSNNEVIFEQVDKIVRENSNMLLAELDRVEERINGKFDHMKQDVQKLREEVHITKYSNDTVELLLKKVADLEKRVSSLEDIA